MVKTKLVALIIGLSLIAGLMAPAVAQTSSQNTMLQNLAGNPDFSMLAGAAKTAGLDTVLDGSTPYTLFAPNNAAFDKIPKDSMGALMADRPKLTSLLNYHVVPGKISYADLAGRSSISTIDGQSLPVARQPDGSITVGGAKVLNQGIDSSNGMIYPVDSVMMPPGFAMPAPAQGQGLPWWLLPLALLGLAALAIYLLTRPRRREEPRGLKAEPVREEPTRMEARRPEETLREVRESTAAYKEPQIMDIAKNLSLPLSGAALTGLNALISKGTFKDRQDFAGFLGKQYLANNMESAMAGGKAPSENMIMDVINKTGIANGFSRDDTMKMLVPLLITGFTAVYNYLHKKPAVPAR